MKPEYNYLIPDNLQLVPKKIVAERTSPTNISLSVLGVVSAYDMGFIPVSGVIERLKGIFDTLMKLERFHGHFINWYEIRELRPLPPRYISTVDSGNLVGHFIAAKEALCQLANSPIIAARHLEFVAHLAGNSFQCRLASLEDLVTFLKEVKQLQEIRSEMLTPIQCRVLSEIAGLGDLVGWTHYLQLIQRLA
ncbi:MAG: hypothetical protein DCC75_05010, partial [Proteobacteria bacterium]